MSELAFIRQGQGSPLILIHGWGLHAGVWQSVLPALAKNFSCYAIDLPGHGESELQGAFNLQTIREALHKLIISLDDESIKAPVILLGWSLGGLVALDYVLHYPQHIHKLILVTTNLQFCKTSDWPEAMDTDVLESFYTQLLQNHQKTIERFMALQLHGTENYKHTTRLLKQYMSQRNLAGEAVLQAGLDILKTTDLREQCRQIQQPVLLLSGKLDRLVPASAGEAMTAFFHQARHRVIEGCGHAPFISQPELFTSEIENFCYVTD